VNPHLVNAASEMLRYIKESFTFFWAESAVYSEDFVKGFLQVLSYHEHPFPGPSHTGVLLVPFTTVNLCAFFLGQ
jgi:hypothetical protein